MRHRCILGLYSTAVAYIYALLLHWTGGGQGRGGQGRLIECGALATRGRCLTTRPMDGGRREGGIGWAGTREPGRKPSLHFRRTVSNPARQALGLKRKKGVGGAPDLWRWWWWGVCRVHQRFSTSPRPARTSWLVRTRTPRAGFLMH